MRFGTVLVASGDMRPGVIKTHDGLRCRFQLASGFSVDVGALVAFRVAEEDGVTFAFDVAFW